MNNNEHTVNVEAQSTDSGLENAPRIVPEKKSSVVHADNEETRAPWDGSEPTVPETPASLPQKAETPVLERATAADALSDGGLDIAAFEAEYEANGALSDESYARLEKAGLTRDVVDRYIEAQAVAAQKTVEDVKAVAGGEDAYARMILWAKDALETPEIETFNRVMDSGDISMIRLAVAGLTARWKHAEGSAPTSLVSGNAAAGRSRTDVFQSSQEVVEAMRDKRYGRDPAYTRAVEQRIGRSSIF